MFLMSSPFEQDSIETLPAPPERKVPSERKAPVDSFAPSRRLSEFEDEIPTVVRVRRPRYTPPPRSI